MVTHEHSDHIGGVTRFANKFSLPVWLTHGSLAYLANLDQTPLDTRVIDSNSAFAVGDLYIEPFPVPHDAREPIQFVFGDGQHRLGVLTDTGMITPHIEQMLSGCDALVLECNHDANLLANGPYPTSLKQRVGGRFGHLDNSAAADLLRSIDTQQLTHLVAAHLSQKNNLPELARAALAERSTARSWIGIADQALGLIGEGVKASARPVPRNKKPARGRLFTDAKLQVLRRPAGCQRQAARHVSGTSGIGERA